MKNIATSSSNTGHTSSRANRPAPSSNFDGFWIYDFNSQLFDPVERIFLRDLASSGSSFGFLLPTPELTRFGNHHFEVIRKAAEAFADVFRKIITGGEDRTRAQRYILQLLVSVVSDDTKTKAASRACILSWKMAASSPKPSEPKSEAVTPPCMSAL